MKRCTELLSTYQQQQLTDLLDHPELIDPTNFVVHTNAALHQVGLRTPRTNAYALLAVAIGFPKKLGASLHYTGKRPHTLHLALWERSAMLETKGLPTLHVLTETSLYQRLTCIRETTAARDNVPLAGGMFFTHPGAYKTKRGLVREDSPVELCELFIEK